MGIEKTPTTSASQEASLPGLMSKLLGRDKLSVAKKEREAALGTCAAELSTAKAQVATHLDPEGKVANREGLIGALEGFGVPEGNLDNKTVDQLLYLGKEMPLTDQAKCEAEAHGEFIDSLKTE